MDGDLLRLTAFLAAAALVLLALTLVGWWAAGAWLAQGILALAYLVVIGLRGPDLDTAAPALAAALLLAGELAALARALLDGFVLDSRDLGRRLLVLAGLGTGSAAVGWVLLAASAAPLPGGMLTTALGAAAAVGAVGLVLALARPAT